MIVFLSVVYNMKFRKRWSCSARADGERFFVRAKTDAQEYFVYFKRMFCRHGGKDPASTAGE